ncbi:MAG: hypothetical protein ACREJN_18085 [Nitrospiraceae bacterium]
MAMFNAFRYALEPVFDEMGYGCWEFSWSQIVLKVDRGVAPERYREHRSSAVAFT